MFLKYLVCHIVMVHTIVSCISASEAENYTQCATLKKVLLQALFETDRNLYELDRVFAPARVPSLRYVQVEYSFADSEGKYGDCKVLYHWAIGGFLLVQPPHIFMYTSLLFWFSPTLSGHQTVTLKLPYPCRGLVNSTNGTCSCHDSDADDLQILTRQINQYSRYTNHLNAVQDYTSSAQAVCNSTLKESDYFSNGIELCFVLVFLIPVILTAILLIVVRSAHEEVQTKLTKMPMGYRNLAGVTLAGMHILFYMLVMDSLAVHNFSTETYELRNSSVQDRVNFYATAVTLSLNLLATMQFVFFMMYLCCSKLCGNGKWCLKSVLFCFIMPYVYAVLGREKTRRIIQDMNRSENRDSAQKMLDMWVVTGLTFAPLFSCASHAGYILIAWITEPARTTAVFLVALASFMYLFLIFRQCYVAHEESEEMSDAPYKWLFLPLIPLLVMLKHFSNMLCLVKAIWRLDGGPPGPYENLNTSNNKEPQFSTRGFFMALSWGWMVAGSLLLILYTLFIKVPVTVSSNQLTETLETTVQIVIVFLGFLISYRLLTTENSEIAKLMQAIRKLFGRGDGEDVEAARQFLQSLSISQPGPYYSDIPLCNMHHVHSRNNSSEAP